MSVCFFIVMSQVLSAVAEAPIKWMFWRGVKNLKRLIKSDLQFDEKLILLSRISIEMDRNTFLHDVLFLQYLKWCNRTGQLNELEYTKFNNHFVLVRNI